VEARTMVTSTLHGITLGGALHRTSRAGDAKAFDALELTQRRAG